MSLIDELTDWQRKVLLAAGCLNCERNYHYSGSIRWFFTKDWNADQAEVALIVLGFDARVIDKNSEPFLIETADAYYYDATQGEPPYNIVLPETVIPVTPKPEPWTVDSLMAAMRAGRRFKASKVGFRAFIFREWDEGPTLMQEVMLTHALNPANGWQIEEIV